MEDNTPFSPERDQGMDDEGREATDLADEVIVGQPDFTMREAGQPSTAVDASPPSVPTATKADVADAGADKSEVDPVEALVKLLLGGAIEGADQLLSRLQQYESQLLHEKQEGSTVAEAESAEDRLRFAFVGFVLEAQRAMRRNSSLLAQALDRTYSGTARLTEPVRESALFRPFRQRYEKLIARGEGAYARWISAGREAEPHSRRLAAKTYTSLIDEFINQLAENPELQEVVTKQGVGLAYDVRDDVRERTVTADNLLESAVRRILRRSPRGELPLPPTEVQEWAGVRPVAKKAQLESKSKDATPPT